VFRTSEQEAKAAAAADPATCTAARRSDARRSVLGLQVELGRVSAGRLRCLVEQSWRQQVPERLAAEHGRDESASASTCNAVGMVSLNNDLLGPRR
jgi:hypothetical protein